MDGWEQTQTKWLQTEANHFSTFSFANTALKFSQTIAFCNIDIEFAEIARNLGSIVDNDLLLKPHIIKTCKAAYIEIRV